MLRLKGITKNYKVAGGEIEVLKGLDVCFRKNEFVSILGPSGCGKTTTLNIVGGLDKYTKGDLIISGKSTKNFKDHDWDIYRNQRIGFIFQSYNLIPHQTVLGNVELSLTISGISKEERVERSIRALERVGLKGEEYKRPNQLSGGQCQRVAIARALVNEPDILLADEPTGALDSKTSVQIMELIKEISKDKLVIMVTHNGEIAEQYSSRIIRLVDGEITEDTNPYSEADETKEYENLKPETGKKKKNKAKMSWWTAFKLSTRNLLSKKKRTLLTSIAGSIGIIGISAVLAVSSGVTGYIDNMQDDMLSGNPITITETAFNLDAMMEELSTGEKKDFVEKKENYVNIDATLAYLSKRLDAVNTMIGTNNLTKDYVDYVKNIPSEQATVVVNQGLNVTNNIYTNFTGGGDTPKTENISLSALKNIYTSVMKETDFGDNASFISMLGDIFMQAPNDEEYILSQYELNEGGRIAKEKNEIMIVVNGDKALTDLMLAQLGYYTQNEFINIAYEATGSGLYDSSLQIRKEISYDELINREFVWYDNDTVFNEKYATNPADGLDVNNPFTYNYKSDGFDKSKDNEGMIKFKVVGILTPKENLNYGCLQAGFYYTEEFARHAVASNNESKIVKYLRDDLKISSFNTMLITQQLPNGTEVVVPVPGYPTITYQYDYFSVETDSMSELTTGYVGKANTMTSMMSSMSQFFGQQGNEEQEENASPNYEVLSLNLRELGADTVSNDIKIYAKSLDMKEYVLEYLNKWNDKDTIININGKNLALKVDDNDVAEGYEPRTEIKYTDTLSLIMTMITSMVDIVTIALISFTSLALVVSCVMISIVTYVSVVERVKEIGVVRSLGGRKKDVSNLFNAETLIIGASSGLIGIGFTYFMSFIVNLIVKGAIGFPIMTLKPVSALIMLLLSVGLTVLSGLIPAKKASRQDPVVALRTE